MKRFLATPSAHDDDHDKPLAEMLLDLERQERINRRAVLRRLGGAGLLASPFATWAAIGCGEGASAESLVGSASTTTPSTCAVIPTETNGPYPADGSNASGQSTNVLTNSGIVRSDIRSSFGSASATATGIPLTFTLQLVNTSSNCALLEGLAVYVWHCTSTGLYSLYSNGVTTQNYLRGVQATDSSGQVTFTTIFPGCYAGRWPHIHFEVYRSLATATTASNNSNLLKISQLALPETDCRAVYADSGYGNSLRNLNNISLSSDNVFSDGVSLQMASVTGNASSGYNATLQVGVAA